MRIIDFKFATVDTPVSNRSVTRWGKVTDFPTDNTVKVTWFDASGFEVYTMKTVQELGLQFWA
jgi:hypothetical protein